MKHFFFLQGAYLSPFLLCRSPCILSLFFFLSFSLSFSHPSSFSLSRRTMASHMQQQASIQWRQCVRAPGVTCDLDFGSDRTDQRDRWRERKVKGEGEGPEMQQIITRATIFRLISQTGMGWGQNDLIT